LFSDLFSSNRFIVDKYIMSEVFYCRWSPPQAARLSELEGCSNDMWLARDFCARFDLEAASTNRDYLLMDALETAALVRYCRCFTSGKRLRLVLSNGPLLTSQECELHDRIRAIRDKHIAHPVNLLEIQSTYISVKVAPSGKAVATSVSSGTRDGLSLFPSEATAFAALCAKWMTWLNDAMDVERSRLLPLAQTLSSEQLLNLPRGPIEPDANPRKARPSGLSLG
jgi:hypothetical protein